MVAGTTSRVFFNEFHYDNDGTDAGEFIEIANTDGIDLTGWTVVLYNGTGGASYNTILLSGTALFQTLTFPANGIQNGAPDGFALVDPMGVVVQFLSYEGTFTATSGPANGLLSTSVGVEEVTATPLGFSLQLTGSGETYGDFTWTAPAANTSGALNTGQTFGAAPEPGVLSVSDADVVEGNSGTTVLVFTVTRTGGSAGAVSANWGLVLDGSADGTDLDSAQSGTVSFADGQTSTTITVLVNGDTAIETDETFTLALSAPTGGATLGDASATGTIEDDDTPVVLANVFINEVHYDNASTDANEAIEIAGAAGTDLTGWSLVLYNGSTTPAAAPSYATIALSGIIPNQDNGFGTVNFNIPGIQNGANDGIALVDASGQVVQFISYEGALTAANGPAAGMTSEDIGAAEDGGTALGLSLQLVGSGSEYGDFSWSTPIGETRDAVNTGQDFLPPNPSGSLYIGNASVAEGDSGTTAITFMVRRAGGTDGSVSADYAVQFIGGAQGADAADLSGPTTGTVSFADGQAFAEITLLVAGDTLAEPSQFFDVVLSNITGGADIRDGSGRGTIVNDDPLDLLIGEIQGESHASPFADNVVTTRGIVTATTTNGFYLQDGGDGNSATSDAIFVFTSTAPTVVAGDGVTLVGTVTEFLGGGDAANLTITEITSPTVTVTSSGNALPTALLIGPDGVIPPTETIDDDLFALFDPASDGIDFWESLEGMLVEVQNPVAVSSTNGFGELWTVASDGAGNLAASNVAASGLVTVDGGAGGLGVFNSGAGSDFNPERVQIDIAGAINGLVLTVPDVTPGTVLNNVTGVVDYAFGNYEVRPTQAITVAQASTNVAETTTLTGAVNQLLVASYNVLNLDINDADGDDDVANGRFDAVAFDIATHLALPDIVVLQEIQDDSGSANDGTVSSQLTLQALADSIFDLSGVVYNVFDNPFVVNGETGGQPGGNIRVAFLYRDDRVGLDESTAFTITDPADGSLAAAFQGSRAPLGADFTFNGETVTVIGNHFTSKIGSDTTFTANQLPTNAAELTRAAQAAAVNATVDALLSANADANVIVTGDFNEFQFEEPLQVLTGELDYAGGVVTPGSGAVLENLAYLLAPEERYSALFEGNAQMIDHIFVTRALAEDAAIDVVHTNIPLGSIVADHDPVLARFNVGVQTLTGGPGNDELIGNSGRDVITGGPGQDLLIGGNSNDVLFGDGGNDTLAGGGGDDDMRGGTGNDRYTVGSAGDLITELLDEGTDRVDARIDWTLGDNLENLFLRGTASSGTGNGLNNAIYATSVDSVLSGLGGNDRLTGNIGDDTLNGGDDNDRLIGGAGNDLLNGDDGNDTVQGGAGMDVASGGNGNDFVTGGADIDTLSGNAGIDRLFGDAGNDRLTGGADRDVLTGGTGADTFMFAEGDMAGLTANTADRIIDFDATAGDVIDLSGLDAILGGSDDAFAFIGTDAFSGTAGELRWQLVGSNTMIFMDFDGDASADYAIHLVGQHVLTETNFIA